MRALNLRQKTRRLAARRLGPTPIVALLAASLVMATPAGFIPAAHAQAGMSAEDMERFKLRVSDGKRLFEMGKYRAAIEQFQAARALHDHPLLTFNIAQASKALGECDEADEAFRRYLEYDGINDEMRQRAQRMLADLDEACVETGVLQITCNPDSAEVVLTDLDDAGEYYECDSRAEVPVGQYRVSASAPGFKPTSQQVEVTRGTSQVVHLNLSADDQWLSPQTESIIAYSLMGAGAALLVGGVISDYSSVSRLDELKDAQAKADYDRIADLQDDADSAATRTAILYGVGGAVLVGGLVWKIVQLTTETAQPTALSAPKEKKQRDQAGFSVDFGPAGLQTGFHW